MALENLSKCALCGEVAEVSDANEQLMQCSNGACKQAAWGVVRWNINQKVIACMKRDSHFLHCLKRAGVDNWQWYGEAHKAAFGDDEEEE